jgi:hypothetical protein
LYSFNAFAIKINLKINRKDKSFSKLYLIRVIFRIKIVELILNLLKTSNSMKLSKAFKTGLFVLMSGLFSCATQNPGTETDDMYHSSEDRSREVKQKNQEEQKVPKVKETKPAQSDKNNYNFDSRP